MPKVKVYLKEGGPFTHESCLIKTDPHWVTIVQDGSEESILAVYPADSIWYIKTD